MCANQYFWPPTTSLSCVLLAKRRDGRSVEEGRRMSFLLKVLPSLFFFPVFFLPFSLKASHALGSPLEPMSFRKLCEAFVNLHGQDLLIAPIYPGRKHSIAEKALENFRLRDVLFVFSNRNRVEIISSCLPLCFPERSAGFERWKQGRWCVPCSSSSPASPRSCRSSPVTSSRCSVSWTSSGCSVTKMASQVRGLGSLSNYPNGFMSSFTFSFKLMLKDHTAFWELYVKMSACFLRPEKFRFTEI